MKAQTERATDTDSIEGLMMSCVIYLARSQKPDQDSVRQGSCEVEQL